jgi:hypothetical protein
MRCAPAHMLPVSCVSLCPCVVVRCSCVYVCARAHVQHLQSSRHGASASRFSSSWRELNGYVAKLRSQHGPAWLSTC